MDLVYLKNIATKAAIAAGKVIQKRFNDDIKVETKDGGSSYNSQVVTVVDKECESIILSHLLPTCDEFDFALLSEETEDDGNRFVKDNFWCIDPMDGTLSFINKRPGYSVSIALVSNDGTPIIGVVLDPSTNNIYHAIKGFGAFKNDLPFEIKNTDNHLTYLTDRKLQDIPQGIEIEKLLSEKAKELGLSEVKEIAGAGAVLNGMLVLENGPACMMKLPKKENGGGSVWDYAAISCIYHELGLPANNFKGDKLDLNRKGGTFMNHQGIYFANFKNY
ncbi:MAG: inositol monophosphatase [Bacteroidia bacterium]|nr:inositol monophosphatase [Bacteroidia bacterium]